MKQSVNQMLFELIRSSICNKTVSKESFSIELLPDVFKLAQKHDVSHLVAVAVLNNKLIEKDSPEYPIFMHSWYMAMCRYETQSRALDELCNALEEANIPFMPLKGSVIRKLYREPWMRTGCDIDVLVYEKDLNRVTKYLVEHCGYEQKEKNSHDISLFTANGVHIELHYDLMEEGRVNNSSVLLKDAWNYSSLKENFDYQYEMKDEMFYFYHIAHMAKHVETGGCGIRPFIDLWILDNTDINKEKRAQLLEIGGLVKFTEVSQNLSRVWLGIEEHNSISLQLENFILSGGAYGTMENNILVQQQKKGGHLKYALSKIFIPYDEIKFHYPILEKHRWLTPFMEVRRWGKLTFCGHAKRTMKELKYNSSISDKKATDTQKFLENIGL